MEVQDHRVSACQGHAAYVWHCVDQVRVVYSFRVLRLVVLLLRRGRNRSTWRQVVGLVAMLAALAGCSSSDVPSSSPSLDPPATSGSVPAVDSIGQQYLSSAIVATADGNAVLTGPIRQPATLAAWIAADGLLDKHGGISAQLVPIRDKIRQYFNSVVVRLVADNEPDITLYGVLADALLYQRVGGLSDPLLSISQREALGSVIVSKLTDATIADRYGLLRLRQALLLDDSSSTGLEALRLWEPDEGLICAWGEVINSASPDSLALIGYEIRSNLYPCLDKAKQQVALLEQALPTLSDPYPVLRVLAMSGTVPMPLAGVDLSSAVSDAEAKLVASPSADSLIRLAVLSGVLGAPQSHSAELKARLVRFVVSGGWNPDQVMGQTDSDAFLLSELDAARGITPPSPLSALTILDELPGTTPAERLARSVEQFIGDQPNLLEVGCNSESARALADSSPTRLTAVAAMVVAAAFAAGEPCDSPGSDVAQHVRTFLTSSGRLASPLLSLWASAYVACRSEQSDTVRDYVASRIQHVKAFDITSDPLDYDTYFSAYANEWLRTLASGEATCADLTLWSKI